MYEEIVSALRYCGADDDNKPCYNCPIFDNTDGIGCLQKLHDDAADAIEELNKEKAELESRISSLEYELAEAYCR